MDWTKILDAGAYGALLGLAGGALGIIAGVLIAPLFPERARKRVRDVLQVVFIVLAVLLIPAAQEKFGPLVGP